MTEERKLHNRTTGTVDSLFHWFGFLLLRLPRLVQKKTENATWRALATHSQGG